MTKCKRCNGSGVVHEYDDYDRMSTFPCHACDGTGEIMTNYDRIMRDMTIEQMAELLTEMVPIRHGWPSDTEYGYENDAGRTWDRETAIRAEIEWLKKECDA